MLGCQSSSPTSPGQNSKLLAVAVAVAAAAAVAAATVVVLVTTVVLLMVFPPFLMHWMLCSPALVSLGNLRLSKLPPALPPALRLLPARRLPRLQPLLPIAIQPGRLRGRGNGLTPPPTTRLPWERVVLLAKLWEQALEQLPAHE